MGCDANTIPYHSKTHFIPILIEILAAGLRLAESWIEFATQMEIPGESQAADISAHVASPNAATQPAAGWVAEENTAC